MTQVTTQTTTVKTPRAKKEGTATTTVRVARIDTGKAKAIPLVMQAIASGSARKDTLSRMQSELGFSAAKSNTYYQNIKSGKTGWVA